MTTGRTRGNMNRISAYMGWKKERETEGYRPLVEKRSLDEREEVLDALDLSPFSWLHYSIFVLLGISQLWIW